MLRITRLLQRASVKSLKAGNRTVLLRGFVCETKHSEESGYFYAKCSNLSPQNKGLCSSTAPLLCCWNCNYSYYANIQGTTHFFCPSCNVVQQPWDGRTYFDILNCEQTFDLDTKHLRNSYRKLQNQLHPDKFSLKSETEQTYSQLQSSSVNEAYQTLLKPLSRGLYLLELQGFPVKEENIATDVEFLHDILEMNETLESGSEKALSELKSQIKENLEWCIQEMSDAFENGDIATAKEILLKMKYYDNINEQIKEKLLE